MFQMMFFFTSRTSQPAESHTQKGSYTVGHHGVTTRKSNITQHRHLAHKKPPPPSTSVHGAGLIVTNVIIIGHVRPDGMRATLSSVHDAVVPEDMTINLHICVDGNDTEVGALAKGFAEGSGWHGRGRGKVSYVQRGVNYGLAKHITHCWESPNKDEWALFLEDDVTIAKDAFLALREAILIRENSELDNIVGIALHGMGSILLEWLCQQDEIPANQPVVLEQFDEDDDFK